MKSMFVGLGALAAAFRLLAALQSRPQVPPPVAEPAYLPTRAVEPRRTAPPPPASNSLQPPVTHAVAPTLEPSSEGYREQVGALRRFERRDGAAVYTLNYGFVDHSGRSHEVSCEVSRSDHEWQVRNYGYHRAWIDAQIDTRLQKVVDAEVAARDLVDSVEIRVKRGGGYEVRSSEPGLAPGRQDRRLERLRELGRWLEGPFVERREAVTREVLAQQGLRLEGRVFSADHARLAARASLPLAGCFAALRDAGDDYGERQLLGLFLGFLQEIPYAEPPEVLHGRHTLGLFVPTEVVVDNHGDCDSKSVAFAAFWRNFDSPLLLIIVPDHMLVGVAMAPGPGEHFVQVGLHYFVLCEVAGPEKVHPGFPPIPDRFEYVLIEPAAAGRAAARGHVGG